MRDPTQRFTDRVQDYIQYRPTYPAALWPLLNEECELQPGAIVADVGSGTGTLSSLLLDRGVEVFGVEPNAAMRQAAEELLADQLAFRSIAGRAEATTLRSQSVDGITAGQAFHWFDPRLARREFSRILRPHGWVVLVWNSRRTDSTPFLTAYQQFLCRWCPDYSCVSARYADPDSLELFFGSEAYQHRSVDNEQLLALDGLTGRFLSSSYAPTGDDPTRDHVLEALRELFDDYSDGGLVRVEYDTDVYFSQLGETPMS